MCPARVSNSETLALTAANQQLNWQSIGKTLAIKAKGSEFEYCPGHVFTQLANIMTHTGYFCTVTHKILQLFMMCLEFIFKIKK